MTTKPFEPPNMPNNIAQDINSSFPHTGTPSPQAAPAPKPPADLQTGETLLALAEKCEASKALKEHAKFARLWECLFPFFQLLAEEGIRAVYMSQLFDPNARQYLAEHPSVEKFRLDLGLCLGLWAEDHANEHDRFLLALEAQRTFAACEKRGQLPKGLWLGQNGCFISWDRQPALKRSLSGSL